MRGPGAGDDVEELQGARPVRGVGGVGGVRQRDGEVDFLPFGFVHQQGEFAGQEPGSVGGARGAVGAVPGQDEAGTGRRGAGQARWRGAGPARRPTPAGLRPGRRGQ